MTNPDWLLEVLKELVWETMALGQRMPEHDSDSLRNMTLPDIEEVSQAITDKILEAIGEDETRLTLWAALDTAVTTKDLTIERIKLVRNQLRASIKERLGLK